ncbi:hypothetical protein ABT013_27325 [Streptomyces bacillaris]|uniref:hypothetical protein n=1 Tax=Streptomyces bacillaris TaxID=68179 RepID=UPI00334A3B23
MTETTPRELARITHVQTAAERTGTDGIGELADLAPAAAAALNLRADAIQCGRVGQDAIVEALKPAARRQNCVGTTRAVRTAPMTPRSTSTTSATT